MEMQSTIPAYPLSTTSTPTTTTCNPDAITLASNDSNLHAIKLAFRNGHCYDTQSRKHVLAQLCILINDNRQPLINALIQDGHCSREAVFELKTTETQISRVSTEFDSWTHRVPIETGFLISPTITTRTIPRGLIQIIASSQYPVMHALVPTAASLASGNPVVLCPNPRSAAVYKLLVALFTTYFPTPQQSSVYLQLSLSYVSSVVDFVWSADAANIEPCLNAGRLGIRSLFDEGDRKCVCIVDDVSMIEIACKRVVESCFTSAGFFPYKPSFILTLPNLQSNLIFHLQQCISEMYTNNPFWDHEYSRIPNPTFFENIKSVLLSNTDLVACSTLKLNNNHQRTSENNVFSLFNHLLNDPNASPTTPSPSKLAVPPTAGVVFGGQWSEPESLIIYPTVVVCDRTSPLLTEPNMGPVLPVVVLSQPEISKFLHVHQPFDILYHFNSNPNKSTQYHQRHPHFFRAVVLNDTLSPFRVNDYISSAFCAAAPSAYSLYDLFSVHQPHISAPFNSLVNYRDDLARYPPTTQKKLNTLESQLGWRNVPVPSNWKLFEVCKDWLHLRFPSFIVKSLAAAGSSSVAAVLLTFLLKRHLN